MSCRREIASIALLLVLGSAAMADDWPQWMGPSRDDRWNETGILDKFPEGGPKVLWRVPIAGGYAGPAVAGAQVYVIDFVRESGEAKNDPGAQAELKGREQVICLSAGDGRELWRQSYPCSYKISYPAGPRCTPTVSANMVYTLGAEGNLLCLDALSGRIAWQKDLKVNYKAKTPFWGFCGHPLVDGDKLICLVGGKGSVAVAFDKKTGQELWKALSSPTDAGYCPPTIIQAGGTRQLLIWTPQSLNSLDPETGKLYWTEPLQPDYGMPIAAPRQAGDVLFASGIGSVGAAFKLDRSKPAVELLWAGKSDTAVYCANSTPIIDRGVIYGNDCQVGDLRAVKLDTGERLWSTFEPTTGGERRASHGTAFLTKNGERYFLFSETGDLVIAELSPQGYKEISRAHIIEPTGEAFGRTVVWTHPAYAYRCAFVRNDKEIVCVSLAK